jgi:hypothetical protein
MTHQSPRLLTCMGLNNLSQLTNYLPQHIPLMIIFCPKFFVKNSMLRYAVFDCLANICAVPFVFPHKCWMCFSYPIIEGFPHQLGRLVPKIFIRLLCPQKISTEIYLSSVKVYFLSIVEEPFDLWAK